MTITSSRCPGRAAARRHAGLGGLVLIAVWLPALAQPGGRDIPIAEFEPLPAADQRTVSPQALALRAQLLGPESRDPDFVTLHWYGVASFIVTMRGHLLLFDAWEIVGLHQDYAPIGREELAGLEPEAILIGHGHFDHAADAGYVASRTGAVVVGSEEICAVARADAAEVGGNVPFDCAITGTMDAPAPGVLQAFRLFEDLPEITVLQHIHSAATEPGEDNQPDPFVPVFDPLPYLTHLNDDPEEMERFLRSLGDAQGGTWMYHLRDGDFSLLLGDSAGPIFESTATQAALDAFPGCVDVMANAILGFDQPVSGLQDPVLYVEHAHPRVFLPTHGDAWAPVISAGQAQYEAELREQLATLDHPPELDMLLDPQDYLAQRAFRVDDEIWSVPMPGSSCAAGTTGELPDPGPGTDPDGTVTRSGSGGGGWIVALGVAVLGWRRRRDARPRRAARSTHDFGVIPPTRLR